MTPTAELTAKPLRTENGEVISSAELRCGDEVRDLWFSVSEEHEGYVVAHHDHLVQAALLWAQSRSSRMAVHGVVTRSLTQSLEEFATVWSRWRPELYHSIQIEADDVIDDPKDGQGHVFAFSGGVDASATLRRHTRGSLGNRQRQPSRAVLVHGFDIAINDVVSYSNAFESARRIADQAGVALCGVATNVRDIPVPWTDSFAALVSASLRFVGSSCAGGVMASCSSYMEPGFPWGSNPISNQFLGSPGFPIYTDGADLTRLEKVELLASWPEAVRQVRVCWEGDEPGKNCGKCEKCQRTLLEFLAAGIDDFSAFVAKPQPGSFARIATKNVFQQRFFQEVLECSEMQGRNDWWVCELRSALTRTRRRENLKSIPLLRKTVRAVKQFFPSGTTAGAKP